MAVSLPTAADVRKAREQAVRNAADRAEAARTPLLAVLGAGDVALSTVTRVVSTARTRADLRRTVDELRGQAEQTYAGLAERGENAWGRIRRQPRVERALRTMEAYTEKLDARVDGLVDDTHDAAEKALSTVTRQTRSSGEKLARATQRFAGRAAGAVTEVSEDASRAVAEAGTDAAEAITEAGDEAAHTTRSTSRKAANRTAPVRRPVGKPAPRRTAAADTDSPTSS